MTRTVELGKVEDIPDCQPCMGSVLQLNQVSWGGHLPLLHKSRQPCNQYRPQRCSARLEPYLREISLKMSLKLRKSLQMGKLRQNKKKCKPSVRKIYPILSHRKLSISSLFMREIVVICISIVSYGVSERVIFRFLCRVTRMSIINVTILFKNEMFLTG